MGDWEPLGKRSPRELTEARLQLHWAAQLVAGWSALELPHSPDDSHTAMSLIRDRSLLTSGVSESSTPRRVALSLPDLQILTLDSNLELLDSLALEGLTLQEAVATLTSPSVEPFELPSYDMPSHSVSEGAAFALDDINSFEELAKGFRNASLILEALAPDVKCWPHHFDIAYLTQLPRERSIGVGWSPGDASYDEPYWYVTPWPYPPETKAPPLSSGHWHHEGFVAAVLTHTELAGEGDRRQRNVVESFIESAVAGAHSLLDEESP